MEFNWKKIAVGTITLMVFVAALIYCNGIEKTPLISIEGQSYEKAQVITVQKIISQKMEIAMGNRRLF